MNKTFILILATMAVLVAACAVDTTTEVTDFESCVQVAGEVMESYPRQCAWQGQTYVEELEESPGTVPTLDSLCEAQGGSWIHEANECEGVGKETCDELGGNFNECASACRNDPDAQVCTLQCVQVCEIGNEAPAQPPQDCTSWFDGCNNCMVENGEITGCTKKYCAPEMMEEAKCLRYINSEPQADPEEQANCEAQGGVYEQGGLASQFYCNMPAEDAGKTCTNSDECEGLCLSNEGVGSCSPNTINFGCIPILEDGQEVTICID